MARLGLMMCSAMEEKAAAMVSYSNSSSVVNKSSFSSDSESDIDTVASPVPEELEVCSSFSQIMVLTKRINEVKDKAFLVLIFLAGYAEEYVDCWSACFGKELKLNLKEAEAVGSGLVPVLEMAFELCRDQDKLASNKSVGEFLKPSASEFLEIVDYFRRYTQMMNRLIGRVIPEKTSEKMDLICHLQHKVEVDCSLLNSTIEGAFKDHKCLTVDNHVAWGDLLVDQFLNDSIQKVEEFLDDSICKANLKNIPVLLKNVRHREEDSLET